MEKIQLGTSDLTVSRLGLGCMSLGTDAAKAEKIIHAALEEGINYFDTADLYDFGENEIIVGQALKQVRDQVVIATKVGNRWKEKNRVGWTWDPSKAYIKDQVKQSLKRLHTDYIDLYQLHGGTIDDPIDETIEAFEELKQEGYVRYYGISSIRPNVIREYINKSNIISVMMQYSILDRRPEEVIPILLDHQIHVVARGPIAKGMLTDRLLSQAGDSIKENGYLDYTYEELEELLNALKQNLTSERSMTSIALHYVLSNPAVGVVVPGASSVEQLKNNVNAVNQPPLSKEEIQYIRKIAKMNVYTQHR
ncbi:aryl-alcohol dehydrogenase-like predicted oxidoreductase [Bacillus oleivorans]|uniref:Aryl-alcohol dehydrogenase-like predicted oxidoreductase n=1 Tax=Bacillus oleivorans TaxID=1448271 RepID=A0A285CM23_9BACI|nr:aldo/keto reductase [Bacillus oleivorans]SNX68063.1 aryl-alcohol dehydrogenase-like predicted oxidoreductase [Bacillus oleivorans]